MNDAISRARHGLVCLVTLSALASAALPAHADGGAQAVSSQAISVPKGQGTVEGLGESFSAQNATGTSTFQFPFALPTARGGAQPALTLSYGSGNGAGVAGMGFSVGAPGISRQTDRGIPKYNDGANGAFTPDQDRFVFDGGQELVPICVVAGTSCAVAPNETMPAWSAGWQYFRARVEGAFLRFFWSPDRKTWRIQDKSGETMELGLPLDGSGYEGALERDPAKPSRIFRWNLARKVDAQGTLSAPKNVVVYRYLTAGAVSYLSDVYDTPPVSGDTALSAYAHHTRLVYEPRTDPSVSYRRGWASSSTLRLARVDVTSKGADAAASRETVRRYHLAYASGSHTSLLASITLEGRCAGAPTTEDANGVVAAGSTCPRHPPLTFGYTTAARAGATAEPFLDLGAFDRTPQVLAGAPTARLDASATDFFDINADGLPDILQTVSSAQVPDHGVRFNGANGIADAFGRLTPMSMATGAPVDSATMRFGRRDILPLDVDGDARVDMLRVTSNDTSQLFTPKKIGAGWRWAYRNVRTPTADGNVVNLTTQGASVRVVDVNADGLVDLVMTQGSKIRTFFSLGRYPGGDGRFGTASWTSATTAALSAAPLETCAPGDAVAVQLNQPDVFTADMNGDGLVDLVRMNPGSLEYWPGRGDGSWGAVAPLACDPRRAAGVTSEVTMAGAPSYSRAATDVVRLADVTGDGLDDVVYVSGGNVRVYANLDGRAFATTPLTASVSGVTGEANAIVRLVDVNGSGSTDIVWGSDSGFRYVDFLGGGRPNLLARIANGLGKTTEIEYATSTSLMLDAEKGGAGQAWTSKMPVVAQVVRRFVESDNLPVGGRPANRFVTELTYRNPVYDGAQREFRGFRETIARTLGDANSPPSTLRQRFATGDCVDETPTDGVADCEPQGRYRDNGREALKGAALSTDVYDDNGVYLSTTHHTYTLRHLFKGLDGRSVRHAFASATDTWSYDTASFVAAASSVDVNDVVLDGVGGAEASAPLALASTSGRVHITQTRDLDAYGNVRRDVSLGCVDGCASGDEAIAHVVETALVPGGGDGSGWLWRATKTWTEGSKTAGKRKLQLFEHDAHGNLVVTRAVLEGTLPLDRFHETPGAPIAPAPATASKDGTIVVSSSDYDAYGNATFLRAANNRCRKVIYDGAYATFPSAELTYAGALGGDAGEGSPASQAFAATPSGAACGRLVLPSTATFDRGLGLATQVTGQHGETTRIVYDGLGRMTAYYAPDAARLGAVSALPSVRFSYDVDPTGARAFVVVHVESHDGADASDATYRHSYAYVDGFGRAVATLEQADPSPEGGDRGAWIVKGLTEFDHKGSPERAYAPWFSNHDGAAFPLTAPPETALFTEHRYDAFSREVQSIDTAGEVSLEVRYHALSRDAFDGADLRSPTHGGTFTTSLTDGHGRKIVDTVRVKRAGALELHETRATFLPTGELTSLTRVRVGSSDAPVVRWSRYDSLGRLVLNADPHVARGFALDGRASLDLGDAQRMRALRYAYDDSGAIVGSSDARGCGTSYFFDALGRGVAKDESPCLASQDPYTTPDLTTGDGTESFTKYDVVEPAGAPGCVQDASTLLGRVSSVFDRGGRTLTAYDARGRSVCVARQVAKPGAPSSSLATRYAADWFTSRSAYDAADRATSATTGAEVPELLGNDGASRLTTTYTARGLLRVAGSSYGSLITGIVRTADGRVDSVHYGDGAGTTTDFTFDSHLRMREVTTYRGSAPTLAALAAGAAGSASTTGPALLEDSVYDYDEVGNPTAIDDRRNAAEWADGAKPVARRMTYDDLNRLASITYQHAAGADAWTSPVDAENSRLNGDGRTAAPMPHVAFDARVRSQTYAYDWLGNIASSDDDAHGFFDRSLGVAQTNVGDGKPYQLAAASNGTASGATRQGSVRTKFDDGGYLVDMTVVREGPCLPAGALCSHRFLYAWDEEGNLTRARRWDVASPGVPGSPAPPTAPAAELRYVYASDGNRSLKTAIDARGRELHTVYALGSLELRRARFDGQRYERTAETEVPYLFAHGVRVGRVVYVAEDTVAAVSGRRRVFLELPDHLGSTSTVLDLATGDLVERATYQAYGNADSDYRPKAWGSFREGYRFTGKEDDIEVGIQYSVKRYYALSLGIWLSPDPLAVHAPGEADLNLYAYVHGAVLRATDPLGLDDAPAPLGSAANPVATNQLPSTPGAAEAIKAGQIFTYMKGDHAGVQVFTTEAAAQAAGGRWFYRYDPSASGNWNHAVDMQQAIHAFDFANPESAAPLTAGDLAQRVAHPFTDADPNGVSGGIAGGQCVGPGCLRSGELQALEAGLQIWSAVNLAKAGYSLAKAGIQSAYATIAARIAGDRALERALLPDPTILSGHGSLRVGSFSPIVQVPQGTSVTVYTRHGNVIYNDVGNAIETGREIPLARLADSEGARTYLPGSFMPDYTLHPPDGLSLMGNPTTVTKMTPLSQLVGPGQGNVKFAACLVESSACH